jgi:hypothetical protein
MLCEEGDIVLTSDVDDLAELLGARRLTQIDLIGV